MIRVILSAVRRAIEEKDFYGRNEPARARVAALIQRVIASSMEAQLHDKRLASVTITDVRVTNDLQIAKVYWTQLGHDGREQGERKRAKQALDQAKGAAAFAGRLQSRPATDPAAAVHL